MQEPLIIQFRQMDSSPAIEARIREKVAALERSHPRITRCRVVVEKTQHRHHQDDLCLQIDLVVPGRKIMVDWTGPKAHAQDVYVAIRDAFAVAARKLKDAASQMRGGVKTPAAPTHGEVMRLFPEDGYGFILSSDGHEVYFHRNAVLDDFGQLKVGSKVQVEIAEKEGAEGYQAFTVRRLKHQPVD